MWHLLVVMVLLSLILGRWYWTNSRREAFDQLARLPCGFTTGTDEVEFFRNPNDFLHPRTDSVFTDFFSPPRIRAIHLRATMDDEEKQTFLRYVTSFPELRLVVVNEHTTDAQLQSWRAKMPDGITVCR